MSNIIQLKNKDIAGLRNKILKEQHGICAICEKVPDVATLDHEHKKRFGGSGLIRGVLCRSCNSVEGKIVNALKRFGIKITEMPNWLRSLAKYLEKGAYVDENRNTYLHPTEEAVVKITKTKFNKLMNEYVNKYPRRQKLKYPKGGKATQRIKEIMREFKYD